MTSMIETYRGAVYPWHCDHMGHMNVMWYVGKFDEATWNLFARFGVTSAYLRENSRAMGAVQQNITYKRELLSGDIVKTKALATRYAVDDPHDPDIRSAVAAVLCMGPDLEKGMYYQFRATSWREPGGTPTPISQTEDLKGVFFAQ